MEHFTLEDIRLLSDSEKLRIIGMKSATQRRMEARKLIESKKTRERILSTPIRTAILGYPITVTPRQALEKAPLAAGLAVSLAGGPITSIPAAITVGAATVAAETGAEYLKRKALGESEEDTNMVNQTLTRSGLEFLGMGAPFAVGKGLRVATKVGGSIIGRIAPEVMESAFENYQRLGKAFSGINNSMLSKFIVSTKDKMNEVISEAERIFGLGLSKIRNSKEPVILSKEFVESLDNLQDSFPSLTARIKEILRPTEAVTKKVISGTKETVKKQLGETAIQTIEQLKRVKAGPKKITSLETVKKSLKEAQEGVITTRETIGGAEITEIVPPIKLEGAMSVTPSQALEIREILKKQSISIPGADRVTLTQKNGFLSESSGHLDNAIMDSYPKIFSGIKRVYTQKLTQASNIQNLTGVMAREPLRMVKGEVADATLLEHVRESMTKALPRREFMERITKETPEMLNDIADINLRTVFGKGAKQASERTAALFSVLGIVGGAAGAVMGQPYAPAIAPATGGLIAALSALSLPKVTGRSAYLTGIIQQSLAPRLAAPIGGVLSGLAGELE